jgi:hypothetical protein
MSSLSSIHIDSYIKSGPGSGLKPVIVYTVVVGTLIAHKISFKASAQRQPACSIGDA